MNGKSLINDALSASQCIISIARDYSDETLNKILTRKIADIKKAGLTFWGQQFPPTKVGPPLVQDFCVSGPGPMYAFFIEPASTRSKKPSSGPKATEYSEDRITWRLISQVYPYPNWWTDGKHALVLDKLEMIQDTSHPPLKLDLWGYVDYKDPQEPIRPRNYFYTVCAVKKNWSLRAEGVSVISTSGLLKSRYRRIVAVARLVRPYGVFLR